MRAYKVDKKSLWLIRWFHKNRNNIQKMSKQTKACIQSKWKVGAVDYDDSAKTTTDFLSLALTLWQSYKIIDQSL